MSGEDTLSSLTILALTVEPKSDLATLERAVRGLVSSQAKNATVVAWWDNEERTGGPRETWSKACVTRFAAGRGSTHPVRVNDGQYDLFYGTPTGEFAELDPIMVEATHDGAFDNVQGG